MRDLRDYPVLRRRRHGRPAAGAAAQRGAPRRSAACWSAARRAPRSRPWCGRWPRCCPPVDVVAGCRFACDPAAPDPDCPDGPHDAGGAGRRRPAAAGRAAGRRVRGPARRLAGPGAGAGRGRQGLRAGAAGRARTAACSTSTRSTCCTTTWSTCCSTPPRWAARYVEREGVSVRHAARFLLVGTMNPEEGELRPQLLDRFGLTVEVAAARDPADAGRGGPPPAGVRRRPGRLRRAVAARRGRAGRADRRRARAAADV